MAALFLFEIHKPYRKFYSDMVECIVARLVDGEIGVYAGHTFFTAPTQAGVVKIKDKKGVWNVAFAAEGILEVKGHKSVLLVDAAELPEEIDYDRAVEEKKCAEDVIHNGGGFTFEVARAKISLARAEARLKAWGMRKKKTE
ncbi:MAG: ATP synthase F1 subunit epsilon [Treponema sp.]|jgi:F-type H+-transporting ATPase subunit epsilon|nr:ATP synthase F1 subunit epsilon [Treponema sp.]